MSGKQQSLFTTHHHAVAWAVWQWLYGDVAAVNDGGLSAKLLYPLDRRWVSRAWIRGLLSAADWIIDDECLKTSVIYLRDQAMLAEPGAAPGTPFISPEYIKPWDGEWEVVIPGGERYHVEIRGRGGINDVEKDELQGQNNPFFISSAGQNHVRIIQIGYAGLPVTIGDLKRIEPLVSTFRDHLLGGGNADPHTVGLPDSDAHSPPQDSDLADMDAASGPTKPRPRRTCSGSRGVTTSKTETLPPAMRVAYEQWEKCRRKLIAEGTQEPTELAIYERLNKEWQDAVYLCEETGSCRPDKLPKCDTWCRYVRGARRMLGEPPKNTPRAGRDHPGRSVVPSDRITPSELEGSAGHVQGRRGLETS